MSFLVTYLLPFGSATPWNPWDTLRSWRSLTTRTEFRPAALTNQRVKFDSPPCQPLLDHPGTWEQPIRELHQLSKSIEFSLTHWFSRGSWRSYWTCRAWNLLHHQAVFKLKQLTCRARRSRGPPWPWDTWFTLVAGVTIA